MRYLLLFFLSIPVFAEKADPAANIDPAAIDQAIETQRQDLIGLKPNQKNATDIDSFVLAIQNRRAQQQKLMDYQLAKRIIAGMK